MVNSIAHTLNIIRIRVRKIISLKLFHWNEKPNDQMYIVLVVVSNVILQYAENEL